MSTVLNIALITESVLGTQKSVMELEAKLRRDGLNPEQNNFAYFSYSSNSSVAFSNGKIELIQLPLSNNFLRPISLFFSTSLVRAAKQKEKKFDLIIVYNPILLLRAKKLQKVTGGKIALYLTNTPDSLSLTRRFGFFKKIYYKFVGYIFHNIPDYCFVISDATKRYAIDMGIDDLKIKTFSPKVFQDFSIYDCVVKGTMRSKYGIPQDAKLLLSVGRLEKEKNFPYLIKLFSKLKDLNVFLIIVGDGSERRDLEDLVKSLNLEKRVIFTGAVPHTAVWSFYKDADAFILLSRSEALGLVFWEAMYCGLPVLGSRVGGIIETIGEKEERGYFIEEGSAASKILEALSKKAESLQKTISAREYVLEKNSKEFSINKILL